jgi:hypothetical protein
MTGYEGEKQKEYNKKYYEANKLKIAEQISKKEACKHCGRMVRHDNIAKHMKTDYCITRRHAELNPTIEQAKKEESDSSDSEDSKDSDDSEDSDDSDDSDDDVEICTKKTCRSKDKEYVKTYNQQYYQKVRGGTLAKMSKLVVCECGAQVTAGRLNKHKKTQKHIRYLAKL